MADKSIGTGFIWPGSTLKKAKKVPKGPVGDKKEAINPDSTGMKSTITLSYTDPFHKWNSSMPKKKSKSI